MRLVNKSFFAPYYIFIKDESKLSDAQLLQKLGLNSYKLIKSREDKEIEEYNKRCLYITEDGKWTHLMDNWYYTLWHHKVLKTWIKDLSKEFDIFCCSVGDFDYSFDFVYYRLGILEREYVVEDPKINGVNVVKNNGETFEIEPLALAKKDPLEKVLTIAEWLGIGIQHNLETIRCYEILDEKMINSFDFQEGY